MSSKDHSDKRHIYVSSDFLQQFVDAAASIPFIVNLNSARAVNGFRFDAGTDTVTVRKSGLYQCQFSIQLANVAFPPPQNPNPVLTFAVARNGGIVIPSQTSFNANTADTIYVTSNLLLQYLDKGDRIQIWLTGPNPLPSGSLLRIDYASLTLIEL